MGQSQREKVNILFNVVYESFAWTLISNCWKRVDQQAQPRMINDLHFNGYLFYACI